MNCSFHLRTCPWKRAGSVRSSAALTPTSTPGVLVCRSDVLTQPSNCTRAHSPERDRMRRGVSDVMAPAGGPSGARYSVVRRIGWALEGCTAAGADGLTPAPCTAVTGGAFELSEAPPVTLALTAPRGRTPTR